VAHLGRLKLGFALHLVLAYLSISVNIPKLHSDALASLLPVDIVHETCRIENIYARLG